MREHREPLQLDNVPSGPGAAGDGVTDRRQAAIARLVVALVALVFGGGIFYVTSGLALGWRIGLAILVAAPFLLLVDLLRDR